MKGQFLFPVIFLLFVAVPIIEIAIFIKVGGLIGVLPTLALVIGVAIFGTWLLRQQGLATFTKAQAAMNRGEMPVGEMLDGFFLVLAALLMVTPGLLTDAIGFALLVPRVRKMLGVLARRWVMARTVQTTFYQSDPRDHGNPRSGTTGPIIDGEASEVDETVPRLPPDPR
ncbi:MAG: FxsA family protein [Parvibaculum sp.]|nr:FxsA family protein [Parvibaculum sp.]|tara:strand:- start:7658 stop:8167 length:510 start_codon:yes stop_codon:yes gene_type:complete